jgi:hypothetical protein
MFIKVINWCGHALLRKDNEAAFYLEKDNWDDNYYKTRYHLHLSPRLSDDGEPVWIGEVKILKKGQRPDENFQLEAGKLDFLDFRFCSIGQSLDYYNRIARLEKDARYEILSALRDVIIFPDFKNKFENEVGLTASLFHFLDDDDDIFTLAPAIISGDYTGLNDVDTTFTFQTEGMSTPMRFEFETPENKYGDLAELQTRVCVITGSQEAIRRKVLNKLARISFASNDDRDVVREEGTLEPGTIGFTKIICLSYRQDACFTIPAIYLHEKEQIVRDLSKGLGRFVHCGNHDLEKELEESLTLFNIDDTDGRVWEDDNTSFERQPLFLKTNEDLTSEFVQAIEAIELDLAKQDLLDEIFAFMQEVPDLQFISNIDFKSLRENELQEFFEHLAGESQILFHCILNLILKITPRSLVLFDSPEASLRPTLVALLLKSIRHILYHENAVMIISTQSTTVLQETKRKNVNLLKIDGDSITVSEPEIETFGESPQTISAYLESLSPKKNSEGEEPSKETFENFHHDF